MTDLLTVGFPQRWNNSGGGEVLEGGVVEDAVWRLDVSVDDGTAWLRPQGDLDMETSPSLVRAAQREFSRGARRIVVDLSQVTFVDSSGIGALVTLWRTVGTSPGGFAIAAPSRAAQSVLATTGIDGLLDRADSLAAPQSQV
ncbi:STAS domain-containing protein [Cryptosporangium sp. NPDC048952]|uniref:STAS domain-containing protein n=1 Tax=Cryptosporangium sp. NPDC048952 TaxID=3363961 RepID=UPI00371FAD9F